MRRCNQVILLLLNLVLTNHLFAAEQISLSGTLQSLSCPQACGICCGTQSITDTSGNLTIQVGNAFVDLAKFVDDGAVHHISGHYYDTAGQCGVGMCSLFAIEAIDVPLAPAALFKPAQQRLSIQAVVIDGDTDSSYAVTLDAPFIVSNVLDHADLETVPQGGDCSADNKVCSSGTVCVAYYGIAGPGGPEFKTCEIPCAHPGASCPLGQACATIADGPGQVCTVD